MGTNSLGFYGTEDAGLVSGPIPATVDRGLPEVLGRERSAGYEVEAAVGGCGVPLRPNSCGDSYRRSSMVVLVVVSDRPSLGDRIDLVEV